MLFIIAGADILLHEVTTFVERLKKEAVVLNSQLDNNADNASASYEIEGMVFDNMLHGWLDRKLLPVSPLFFPFACIPCYLHISLILLGSLLKSYS